jgi:chromate transporter
MILLQLFWAFLQIGLFSIGGGYAAMPLIQNQVIDQFHWMTVSEFTDLITISQMTPGPIAINSASFIGARMAGIPGALIATVGCILPSCVIVSGIALLYKRYSRLTLIDGILKGIRPAVVGMIASAALTMMQASWFHDTLASVRGVDVAAILIFAGAFFALRKWKPSPILVMCAAGGCGLLVYGLLDLLGKG